jgi:signal transduction histidine kinase
MVTAVTAVAAFGSLWPMWSYDVVKGVINLLVAVSFVATGAVLGEEPTQRANARALVLSGLFWLVSWWNEWEAGPFPLLAETFGSLWYVFGGLALLRYPDAVLAHRSERVFLVGLGVWVCVTQFVAALFSRPEWHGFDRSLWWPTMFPDRAVSDSIITVFYAVTGLAAGIMLVFFLLKWRRVRGIDRIDALPVTIAAGSVALVGGVYLVIHLLPHSTQTTDKILTVVGLAALITPLAFLTAVLQRRLARSSVADLVIVLAASPTLVETQAALRGVLRDPTLRLWLWLPAHQAYVNDSDQVASSPPQDARWSVPVRGQDAKPLAVLVIDPALQRHPRLVESTVLASGLSLENGRLRADLEKQLAEVRASRARIVEAGMVERRRIERDLHDGAQQSLLAVAATLGVARIRATSDEEALEAIDRARSTLQTALRDLRQLAHGIHPAVLTQSGLGAAVESVTEGIPFPVELTIPDRRWPPSIESAVYFLACEALANAVKHAHATQAVVEIHSADCGVTLRVSDNGRGGASATDGGGLAGVADRIHALGGHFDLNSPPGRGTTITAHLPCE